MLQIKKKKKKTIQRNISGITCSMELTNCGWGRCGRLGGESELFRFLISFLVTNRLRRLIEMVQASIEKLPISAKSLRNRCDVMGTWER